MRLMTVDLLAPPASLLEPQWEGLHCSYLCSVKPPHHLMAEETEAQSHRGSRGFMVPGLLLPTGLHCEGSEPCVHESRPLPG